MPHLRMACWVLPRLGSGLHDLNCLELFSYYNLDEVWTSVSVGRVLLKLDTLQLSCISGHRLSGYRAARVKQVYNLVLFNDNNLSEITMYYNMAGTSYLIRLLGLFSLSFATNYGGVFSIALKAQMSWMVQNWDVVFGLNMWVVL